MFRNIRRHYQIHQHHYASPRDTTDICFTCDKFGTDQSNKTLLYRKNTVRSRLCLGILGTVHDWQHMEIGPTFVSLATIWSKLPRTFHKNWSIFFKYLQSHEGIFVNIYTSETTRTTYKFSSKFHWFRSSYKDTSYEEKCTSFHVCRLPMEGYSRKFIPGIRRSRVA